MAQLKDTIVSGNLRVTDTTLTDTLQVTTIKAPTSSGGTTYGPGSNGQVLKSNGTTTYWASDSNSDVNVTQTATTTDAAYEVLFSNTADNTTRTETARKNSNLKFNPSTGSLYATIVYAGGSESQSAYPSGGYHVYDCRSVDVTPANGDKTANFYFHMTGTPDTSKWWSVMHVKGWTGAYSAWEMAGPAHNSDQRTTPLYVRTSNINSAWGSWRKIYDTSNKPTASEIGALSSSTTYALSTSVGGNAILADGLAMKTLTAETIDTTTGSFVFKGDHLLGGTYDWAGLQVDASNDAFQLMANGQLMIRQNDGTSKTSENWGDWKGCLLPSNVVGSGGITVTQNDITIGTGDDAFSYKGAVTISHSNSIAQETSTVFKKFSYDGNGHITGVANVLKADITALGIPAQDTKYGISGAYGANSNTWVTTITAGGTGTTSTVPTASTSAYGITKLYDGVDSTSTGLAATANAVKTAYDKANHSHPYLPLAGGTMTGPLTMKANQYSGTYGLDMNNSDIIGANRIVFADLADSYTEGLAFYRTTTDDVKIYDNFWIKDGAMYFTPNAPTATTSYTVLHTGNTSFTQTLSSGTKIGSITIAGTATDIYAPTNTDEKVKVDLFTSTTQTDYMIAGATAAMATTAAHLVIDTADGVASARIRLQKGTTSAIGQARLMLGNNIASGTAKNMQGSILMYASTAKYGTITEAALTDNRTWTMPDKTGTVALTSDIPSFSVTSSGTGPVVTGMSYSSGVLTYTKGRVLSTSGGQWIAGRDNAPVLANSNSSTAGSFYPMGAVKTNTGAWAIGALGNGDSLAFSFSTDTNYSGGSNTTNNYYIGTDGAFTGTAAGLTAKALTAETFSTTDGSFVFKGTSLFGGTDSYDWVGIQVDASNDMFQLVGGGNNGVFFREKDDSSGWSAWYALLTNAMISGSSGITVTPTAFKIGGDDGTTINGAVTISHSNSITASTSTVFKKFSYDACGHITDVAAVAKADIPQLDYIGAKTVGSYWGMTTPANDDSQWIRTSKRGIIPYQLRASDSTATDNTDGSTCYLGTSTWYFAKAFIQEIHGTSFTGTAATADRLKSNSSVGITNGVQYTSGQLTVGTADGNAAEGSNASYKLWSYPAGGTSVSSTSANIQNLRLYWSSTYFRDIFISPNNYDIYHRSVANGTAYAWRKILDSTNYTDYTVTKTGTGATGSWGIDITGSAAGLTAKTLTAETLGTTDGSFVFKGTNLLGATYDWVGFQADADNDKFQIVANNQLMFRQKDSTTWSDWVGCITPNNVSAASGIKVTATTTTIGTGTTAFTYNSGVKIEHDVTTSDDTTDSGSLSHGGTFTAITSVTRDSYGHVTTLNTKTYILPASGNTDTKVNVTLGTTTKAYLLGTSTTPTSSAQAVTSIADTGVYLDTTAGMLTASTFKGGLYSYNPASDQTLSNAYPTYTVAYFQTSSAYGGSTGRTGNSGNNYWAHYLTFTHSDRNYRYLLRFPFWGPPQYQHTNDGGNKRWCSFITDEHAGNYSKYMGTGTTIDPITGAMNCTHRANKLAFLPAANITVQTSTDSGSTWTNLSVSDDLKRKIFSIPVRNSNINIGPSSGNTTTSMQTRIIIECDGRDAVLDRFMFEIGSGHQNIAIDVYAGTTISGLTKIATSSSSSTWAYEAVVTIDHNPDKYYRFSTSNYKYIAFVFRYTYVDSSYLTERGTINGISGYSGNYWGNNCKSNLAHFDHLYSWDIDQNALFPATVQGEKLAVKSGTYTTTIEKGATSADRTLVLPDASGGIGVANILLNDPTNSTNPVPVYGSLSDYDYFTIVIGMNGSNSEQTSSAIIPAVAGSHFFLFQILESVGSGGSMMFPAGVVITTTSTTISFSLGVNRGINIPSSGTATSIASARTAYIKMIIGHKS